MRYSVAVAGCLKQVPAPETLVFPPYTSQQMAGLLQRRLKPHYYDIMDPKALMFVARKVTAFSTLCIFGNSLCVMKMPACECGHGGLYAMNKAPCIVPHFVRDVKLLSCYLCMHMGAASHQVKVSYVAVEHVAVEHVHVGVFKQWRHATGAVSCVQSS